MMKPKVLLFTNKQAPGALANGTSIEKVGSEPGDGHQDGAKGKIVGSIGPVDPSPEYAGRYAYFVEWDDMPGLPVGVSDHRIRPIGL